VLDTKVYVKAAPDVCFSRRLRRDVVGRGRTEASVRDQYERTVRPGAEWFVYPTKKYADLVVSGEEPLAKSTTAVIHVLDSARAARA
jgi:uridine kinase